MERLPRLQESQFWFMVNAMHGIEEPQAEVFVPAVLNWYRKVSRRRAWEEGNGEEWYEPHVWGKVPGGDELKANYLPNVVDLFTRRGKTLEQDHVTGIFWDIFVERFAAENPALSLEDIQEMTAYHFLEPSTMEQMIHDAHIVLLEYGIAHQVSYDNDSQFFHVPLQGVW